MKTSELIGPALDWAVATSESFKRVLDCHRSKAWLRKNDGKVEYYYSPSTDWSHGGPIIERETLTVRTNPEWSDWLAYKSTGLGAHRNEYSQRGPTPLVAAMRSYVASKLGDEVEVPEELK